MEQFQIEKQRTQQPKSKPQGDLGFGKYFSDHMFYSDFTREKGWSNGKLVPYGAFPMDPGASVLHYGQALFEGMKAFRQKDGQIVIMRPEFNYQRMLQGAERLCMEMPSYEVFLKGISALIEFDNEWIPHQKGQSLYLRPTLIGTEAFLGVRPSDHYRFFIIASPVSSYYKEGVGPVKIWVEEEFVRAAPGGLGATKAAANYAGSLKAALEAKKKGYSQVLWLDVNHEYIEEVGTMNVFFVFKSEIITPSLDGTILAGGVRDSAIILLREMGYNVTERKVSWSEIVAGYKSGHLVEAFGTGTAAVISPIGELSHGNEKMYFNKSSDSFELAKKLYARITSIQYGEGKDTHHWLTKI